MAHVHGGTATGRYLGLSITLTLAFVLGEAVAGYFSGSLALLSDAGHNFADALAQPLGGAEVGRRARRRQGDGGATVPPGRQEPQRDQRRRRHRLAEEDSGDLEG